MSSRPNGEVDFADDFAMFSYVRNDLLLARFETLKLSVSCDLFVYPGGEYVTLRSGVNLKLNLCLRCRRRDLQFDDSHPCLGFVLSN